MDFHKEKLENKLEKFIEDKNLKKNFVIKFNSLSFEEIIYLKLYLMFPKIRKKMINLNLWKFLPMLVRRTLYNIVNELYQTDTAKARMLGINRFRFKKYKKGQLEKLNNL
jgi:hypothetical protein